MSYYNNPFEELISLNEASKITSLSSVHLRHLVSSGKIWGRKIGCNWVTSKPAINSYIKQKNDREDLVRSPIIREQQTQETC